jgi:hypothetical protein
VSKPVNAPLVISSLFATSEFVWSIRLAVDPEPFAAGSIALIIGGAIIYTIIAVVGVLLVRAPWARWLALVTTVATLLLGSLGRFDTVLPYVAALLSLIAVGALAGPWLRIWLRQRPGVGISWKAVALPLLALLSVPLAGLSAPHGPTVPGLIAVIAGCGSTIAYVRAVPWSLWAMRIALPLVGLAAGLSATGWGVAAFVAYALVVGGLAWSSDARDALSPVQPPLPPPRVARGGESS